MRLTGNASVGQVNTSNLREWYWQEHTGEELLLNCDSLGDDLPNSVGMRALAEMREQEAGKVGVHALIAGDELIGERETRH